MQQRRIGDLDVSAIGLGAMPLSVEPVPDHDRAMATISAALDAGVTLIDTADSYSPDGTYGHNERIVAEGLKGRREGVVVATKGGHTRDGLDWGLDGRAEYLRTACERSLQALEVDVIDIYQHHRPDPKVEYAETMHGLKDLLDAGLIARAGISNADPKQIRIAHEILGDGLVCVQNQLSPVFRTSLPEVELCTELGLAFIPWSPLGGISKPDERVHPAFAEVALRHGVSVPQVTLAWLLALSPVVVPIPGASRPESILDSGEAADIALSIDEMHALDATG